MRQQPSFVYTLPPGRTQKLPAHVVASDVLHGMVSIPGGMFCMGSDHHYPEEAPSHRVSVDAFWIDRTPVTNREFRKFVNATGYVTFAEIKPDAKDYPGALPHMLKAGSLVFTPPKHAVDDLRDWSQWWNFKFGANWRRPYGPRSSISGLDDHPVVHVQAFEADAMGLLVGATSCPSCSPGQDGVGVLRALGPRTLRTMPPRAQCAGPTAAPQ
jgi:formylglycine-generating enzyme